MVETDTSGSIHYIRSSRFLRTTNCSTSGCKNRSKHNKNLSFHRLPKRGRRGKNGRIIYRGKLFQRQYMCAIIILKIRVLFSFGDIRF